MNLPPFVAGVFGVVGFVVSVLAGLMADNPFEKILLRAMLAAVCCYIVGYIVGFIAGAVSREHAVALSKKVAEADKAEAEEKEVEARKKIEVEKAPA